MSLLFKVPIFLLLALLLACGAAKQTGPAAGQVVDVMQAELPAIAAEFESRYQADDQQISALTRRWRFWRHPRRVEVETPSSGNGELWQLDGKSLIRRQLFHRERCVIEYQNDELQLLAETPSWRKLQLLLAPELLSRLKAGEIDQSSGFPVREYRGEAGNSEWLIRLRLDVGLPIWIERRRQGTSEITEMTQLHPLAGAPWQPTASDDYAIIDFADLGDREHDPLVMKLQSQIGLGHHHHHPAANLDFD